MNSGGTPGHGTRQSARLPVVPDSTEGEAGRGEGAFQAGVSKHGNADPDVTGMPASIKPEIWSKLLREAAAKGAVLVTACEFDEYGRCKLHQHA